MDTGYLTSIALNAARHKRQRTQRKRRQALAGTRIPISTQPTLRTLKPSARRRLKKERAPSLWILPDGINFSMKDEPTYPKTSLLGLPTELRQGILLLSYDVEVMAVQELASDRPWKRQGKSKGRASVFGLPEPSKQSSKGREKAVIEALSDRIAELCQVSKVFRNDMQYVGRCWQRGVEAVLRRKVETSVLGLPVFVVPQGLMYGGNRQRIVVIQGDDKPVRGRRPGKCWYCTERHAPGEPGCPRANDDPGRWLGETRKVGGWRSRTEVRNSFEMTKVVFDD